MKLQVNQKFCEMFSDCYHYLTDCGGGDCGGEADNADNDDNIVGKVDVREDNGCIVLCS